MQNLIKLITVFAAVSCLFPNKINKVDFRGTFEAVSIEINRYSPAFIAHLESKDDLYSWSKEEQQLQIKMLTTPSVALTTDKETNPESFF